MVTLNQLAVLVLAEKWVLCLKHGTKYSHDYVNKLYNMTKRNSNVPFRFACITEDPTGLYPNIVHIPIPDYNLSGWWFKIWLLSKELPINGEILFLDLDIVIVKNIDKLWQTTMPCFIRDFLRASNQLTTAFNSSVFRFHSGELDHIWQTLYNDFSILTKYHGDQDFIFEHIKSDYRYFPDIWIQSYKWEIRNRTELTTENGVVKFQNIITPTIHRDTKILVFHGYPKPEHVSDPIIVSNWQ